MTREERHIAVLRRLLESMDVYDSIQPTEERKKAIKAAIQALSQEPTFDDECQKDMDEAWEQIQKKRKRIPVTLDLTPCDDVISRDAVIRLIENKPYDWSNLTERHNMLMEIRKLPPVTQKSGKWRPVYQGDEIINYRCSECEFGNTFGKSTYRMNYCPNCGAKMVEPQESEEV